MKNVVTIGWSQITWIPTNAQGAIIGLKGLWTHIVKEVAYNYLDLRSVNFRSHTMKQWEVIHVELDGLFYYDPPLKERTVENYMKEHLSLARNAWKKAWVANGEVGCPNKCSERVQKSLVWYWNIPNAHKRNHIESGGFMAMCGIPIHMVRIPCPMQFKLK